MPFGRSAKPNNRSQHSLAVESAGSVAGIPSASGSSGPTAAAVSIPAGPAVQSGALAGGAPSTTGTGTGSGAQPSALLQHSILGPGPAGSGTPVPGSQQQQQQQQQQHQQQQQGPSSSVTSALGQGPSNLSLSANDSFVHQQQTQLPPPPHLYAPASGDPQLSQQQHHHQQQQQAAAAALHHAAVQSQLHQQHQHQLQQQQQLHPINTNPGAAVTDARARKAAHDFVDAVARSQSQRYHQVATPIQPNPSYGASYEDLSKTLQPVNPQHPAFAYQQQPPPPLPQQPQQGTPVEPRRSTRRLLKNILASAAPKNDQHRAAAHSQHHSQSQSQSQLHNFYDTAALPGRRGSSKRISNPNPPALRTGPSQVSLDQQSLDWQSQGTQTQPSPLQNNPHDFQQSTLRRVPTNSDHSPYSDIDEHGFSQQQGQIHVQTQLVASDHQHQLSQVVFDPSTLQYQLVTHSPQHSSQGQIQSDSNSPAYASSSHLAPEHHPNSETISQLSHESPITEGDQHNPSNNPSTAASPAARYSAQGQDFPSRTSSLQPPLQQGNSSPDEAPPPPPPPQQQQQHQAQHIMGAQSGATNQTRRTQDNDKTSRGDMPSGPPPGYRHSQQSSNNMNSLPPVPQGSGQNSFRQSTIQERQPGQFEEQGRNSPQPSEDPEKAFKDLLTKYKNVKRLYFDGKSQIEALNGQVEQLQNAVANQRISQSRTALDDNEYQTRFNRLNGAINNLSFNIRKDWKSLPPWLEKYVSVEALRTGKQEMTAVGRAVITRWIVEEIFHSCFHPGLDPELSRQLKEVEQNIRRFSYTLNSQEEYDALTSKVVSWRMTTLEGLQHVLQSPESENHRQNFTRRATSNLTAALFQYLSDPPPAGVDGSASTIVELAVGIATNLPLESRDVAIIYPLPQENVNPDFMDVEKTPLPLIDTRPPDSDGDADSRGEDSGKDTGADKSSSKERNKSRAGMSATSTLPSILSSAPAALVPGAGNSRKGSVASTTGRKPSFAATDSTTNLALPPKDSNKVRFAGFLAVEVRGRQVLVKAPVWTLG